MDPIALSRYIANGKVPASQIVTLGCFTVRVWTDAEIEHVRELLPKIANGRKTRWKKKQSAVSQGKTQETQTTIRLNANG